MNKVSYNNPAEKEAMKGKELFPIDGSEKEKVLQMSLYMKKKSEKFIAPESTERAGTRAHAKVYYDESPSK